MRIIFVFITLLSLFSCDYSDNRLIFHNLSNDTLFVNYNVKNEIITSFKPNYYRDIRFHRYWQEGCLLPKEQESLQIINKSWEDFITTIPDGKIRIIIFKKQLLDTTKWDRIVKEQISSKIIERDVEDLKILNWIVEYDGK